MKNLFLFLVIALLNGVTTNAQNVTSDTLIVGVYESPPFVSLDRSGELNGVSVWLWERISTENDIEFVYRIYPENESPLHNLQNDLESGEIDLSINPLTITSSRSERYRFTYPFYVGNLTIAKHSDTNLESFTRFFSVFKNKKVFSLTIVLAIMMTFFGLLIWFAERNKDSFEDGYHGVISGLWWSAVTMTTVGYGDKVPITKKGRFVAFLWMVISLVMVSIFTATITSVLTVNQLTNELKDIKSIKKLKVGTVEASASEEYLRRNIFTNVDEYPDLVQGLNGLLAGDIEAFVYDEPWLQYQIQNNDAFKELELIPEVFNLEHYAWPLKKEMDFLTREKISFSILKEVESQEWSFILAEYGLTKK